MDTHKIITMAKKLAERVGVEDVQITISAKSQKHYRLEAFKKSLGVGTPPDAIMFIFPETLGLEPEDKVLAYLADEMDKQLAAKK